MCVLPDVVGVLHVCSVQGGPKMMSENAGECMEFQKLSLLPLWDLGSNSGCQARTASASYPLSNLTCPWQLFDLVFYYASTSAL